MKQLLFSLLFLTILISCDSQDTIPKFSDEFLLQVANDPLFRTYQETVHQDAENIVLDRYDLEGIDAIFNKLPYGENLCASRLAREEFHKVKGGDLYLKIDCERQDIIAKLDEKFNYESIPEDVRIRIIAKYREVNYQELQERAWQLYYKKKN